jgi:molybdenum cofactor cytidylyltransferase
MIFGPTPLDQALGTVLAHTLRLPGGAIKKGAVLDAKAIAALKQAGIAEIIAARLEAGDIAEDDAARRIAEAMRVEGLARSRAATGRVNLLAERAGLLVLDAARIDAINALDEGLTIATLPDLVPVAPRDMLATIKVIPFAVPGAVLDRAEAILSAGGPVLSVAPFRPLRVGLLMTELPGLKESAMEGAVEVTRGRVEGLGGTLLPVLRVPHEAGAVAAALAELRGAGAEMLLIAGASAVVDRRDVGPAGIVAAGGRITHFGMPVDPGNLLCLGEIETRPAMVLPGCARSPKLNGFDWVLQRLFVGLTVGPREVMAMGVGGLLKEIELRPLPREKAAHRPRQVAAILLAAGRSSRMAPRNKLLLPDARGTAMVARVADALLASRARPVLVVTGHEAAAVQAALAGRDLRFAHAADFADGLSASLRAGLTVLPETAEGVVIALGDMPLVDGALVDRLLDAFDPEEGRAIVQPAYDGKGGNPVLWGREFWAEMRALSGDSGARALLDRHADRLVRIEGGEAVLRDFDTPESLEPGPGQAPAPE